MKKKILSFVLALCLIIPCAMVFTACGDKDPEAPTTVYVSAETSLETALSQVAVGGKIVLNADITLDKEVAVTKKVTLDLNGKTITNTVDIWEEYQKDDQGEYVLDGDNKNVKLPTNEQTWSLISVRVGGDLTVTGNGSMLAKENDCYVFDVRGGKLTIENGTFAGNMDTVYVHVGEATINGGTYRIQQLSIYNDSRYLLNCLNENYNNGTAKITVNGGSFENFNPENNLSEGANTNLLADGLTVTETVDGVTTYTVVPATANN